MLSTYGIILSFYSCVCTQIPHPCKKRPWILDLHKSFVSTSLTAMGYRKESLEFWVSDGFTGMTLRTYSAASLYYADTVLGSVAEVPKLTPSVLQVSMIPIH